VRLKPGNLVALEARAAYTTTAESGHDAIYATEPWKYKDGHFFSNHPERGDYPAA